MPSSTTKTSSCTSSRWRRPRASGGRRQRRARDSVSAPAGRDVGDAAGRSAPEVRALLPLVLVAAHDLEAHARDLSRSRRRAQWFAARGVAVDDDREVGRVRVRVVAVGQPDDARARCGRRRRSGCGRALDERVRGRAPADAVDERRRRVADADGAAGAGEAGAERLVGRRRAGVVAAAERGRSRPRRSTCRPGSSPASCRTCPRPSGRRPSSRRRRPRTCRAL